MTSFFLYCIKKMSFSGSPKGTPHDWCRRTMKKNYPEPKKCSICWVSHMFSIWESRYSYGICFGTVYALQNSTPNISTPNILSIFFSVHTRRVEIGHILSRRSTLYIYIYLMYTVYTIHMYACHVTYIPNEVFAIVNQARTQNEWLDSPKSDLRLIR